MSDDEGLFADPTPTPAPRAPRDPDTLGVADWQVEQIRRALDARGLQEMTERQRLIEQLAGRPVAALRDLTPAEARGVQEKLSRLGGSAQPDTRSSWDDRDEDTWIDKL